MGEDECSVINGWHSGPRGRLWRQTVMPGKQPTAIYVWHHGLSEHSARHIAVMKQIAAATGLCIMTYDVHGHGHSPPNEPHLRAHFRRIDDLIDDFDSFIDGEAVPASTQLVPGKKLPIFIGGYSMGGLVAICNASKRPRLFAGLVLSASLIDLATKRGWADYMKMWLVAAIAAVAPHYGLVTRKPPSWVMRGEQAIQDVMEDPMYSKGKISAGTVNSLLQGCNRIRKPQVVAALGDLSIYWQHGTSDNSCSLTAAQRFYTSIPSVDKTFVVVPDAYHDLQHDPQTPMCVAAQIEWFNKHIPPR